MHWRLTMQKRSNLVRKLNYPENCGRITLVALIQSQSIDMKVGFALEVFLNCLKFFYTRTIWNEIRSDRRDFKFFRKRIDIVVRFWDSSQTRREFENFSNFWTFLSFSNSNIQLIRVVNVIMSLAKIHDRFRCDQEIKEATLKKTELKLKFWKFIKLHSK